MKFTAPRIDGKKIEIFGARENNLKNIDLEFKKNNLVVITGVSGSGKVLSLSIQFILKDRGDIWKASQHMLDHLLEI